MKETQIYDADELAERWEYLYAKKTIKDIKKRLEVDYKRGNWHALHIALWTWLSLNGKREKKEWFETFNLPKVKHDCFACEQAEMSFCCCPTKSEDVCYYCPITASEAEECLDGLYGKWALEKWVCTHKIAEREKLAREIATMKWDERL